MTQRIDPSTPNTFPTDFTPDLNRTPVQFEAHKSTINDKPVEILSPISVRQAVRPSSPIPKDILDEESLKNCSTTERESIINEEAKKVLEALAKFSELAKDDSSLIRKTIASFTKEILNNFFSISLQDTRFNNIARTILCSEKAQELTEETFKKYFEELAINYPVKSLELILDSESFNKIPPENRSTFIYNLFKKSIQKNRSDIMESIIYRMKNFTPELNIKINDHFEQGIRNKDPKLQLSIINLLLTNPKLSKFLEKLFDEILIIAINRKNCDIARLLFQNPLLKNQKFADHLLKDKSELIERIYIEAAEQNDPDLFNLITTFVNSHPINDTTATSSDKSHSFDLNHCREKAFIKAAEYGSLNILEIIDNIKPKTLIKALAKSIEVKSSESKSTDAKTAEADQLQTAATAAATTTSNPFKEFSTTFFGKVPIHDIQTILYKSKLIDSAMPNQKEKQLKTIITLLNKLKLKDIPITDYKAPLLEALKLLEKDFVESSELKSIEDLKLLLFFREKLNQTTTGILDNSTFFRKALVNAARNNNLSLMQFLLNEPTLNKLLDSTTTSTTSTSTIMPAIPYLSSDDTNLLNLYISMNSSKKISLNILLIKAFTNACKNNLSSLMKTILNSLHLENLSIEDQTNFLGEALVQATKFNHIEIVDLIMKNPKFDQIKEYWLINARMEADENHNYEIQNYLFLALRELNS